MRAAAGQPDGKVVAAGFTGPTGGPDDFALIRYNTDGTLDAGFGQAGKVITDFARTDDEAKAVAVLADGRILAAGKSGGDLALTRYNPNGSLDTAFG